MLMEDLDVYNRKFINKCSSTFKNKMMYLNKKHPGKDSPSLVRID